MEKQILSPKILTKVLNNKKLKDKKIVLVHGVFDLVHIGHLEYFQEAKKYGDILVVSVTADKYVKKGINKPFYNDLDRCKFLSSLKIVDFVIKNYDYDSSNLIKILKPDYYAKGPDYSKKGGDVAGNLDKELKSLKEINGKFITTSGKQLSSTKILNEYHYFSEIDKNNLLKEFKKKLSAEDFIEDFKKTLKIIKNKKILIIGETIFDEYIYVNSLGQPSKENILAVGAIKNEIFFGGVLPVVKNISQVCNNVTLVSIYNDNAIKKKVKRFLGNKIKTNMINEKSFVDIFKKRFVNVNTYSKIFEVYDIREEVKLSKKLKSYLNNNIKKFDSVIVCDFGHGLINKNIANLISNKSKFLSINVQTNAGNRGFNLFTKYKKSNFLSLDEPELRLGLQEKKGDIKILINSILNRYKNVMVTKGVHGLVFKQAKRDLINLPALSKSPLDTLGAGDSAYSFASIFVNYSKNFKLNALVSAIAGALKIKIIGHRSFIHIDDIYKSIISLTK